METENLRQSWLLGGASAASREHVKVKASDKSKTRLPAPKPTFFLNIWQLARPNIAKSGDRGRVLDESNNNSSGHLKSANPDFNDFGCKLTHFKQNLP